MTLPFQLLITTTMVILAAMSGQIRMVMAEELPREPARLVIDGSTIRIDVRSDWQFSLEEARREADERLLEALWPLALSIEPRLPQTRRQELPRLWLAGPAIRRDRTEERSRAYGRQFQQAVELALSPEELRTGVTALKPVPRSLILAGMAGAVLAGLALIVWLDRLTQGYRLKAIVFGIGVLTSLTLKLLVSLW